MLPEHMVPAAYVEVEGIPLTANGKVDRKALPAPGGGAFAAQGYEPPVGAVETTLARLWSELLGVERVGRHDHFFALGGHSLLAMTLIERMRRDGLEARVSALFASPTLSALAQAIGEAHAEVSVPANGIPVEGADAITPEMLPLVRLSQGEIDRVIAGVPGGARNVQDIYPLTPLQEGILFHHLLASAGDPYVVTSTIGFADRARLDAYLAALQAVIDRHDILRTAVQWEGLPEPVQVVWRRARLVVEEVQVDGADTEAELRARFGPRRFRLDVRQAPLMRVFIARDAARGRWIMLQLSHHLADDNTSLRLLTAEIEFPDEAAARAFAAPEWLGRDVTDDARYANRALAVNGIP